MLAAQVTLQQSTSRPTTLLSVKGEGDVLLRRALGKTIRRLRRDRDLSQGQLGERTGLAQNHIGEIERVPRDLRLQTIVSLARAFDMPASELLAQAETLAREQAPEQPKADCPTGP
jgi:DNA-binding XRE family transcriptional regulator